jgi:hypothetical protein
VISTSLQFTRKPALPNYAGKAFQDELVSFVYSKHSANRPFQAPQYSNYKAVYLESSLCGIKSFYRGTWSGALALYVSLVVKGVLVRCVPEDFSSKLLAGNSHAEVGTSCAAELVVQPLFLAQSRLMLQSSAKNMKTYQGILDVFVKCPRELMQGSTAALLRGGILGWCHYSAPFIEQGIKDLLGALQSSTLASMSAETLSYAVGYWLAYPVLTLQRRLSVQSASVRMLPYQYRGVVHGLWTTVTKEGVSSLYRGFGVYSIAVSCT